MRAVCVGVLLAACISGCGTSRGVEGPTAPSGSAACTFSIDVTAILEAVGGIGSARITTQPGCGWRLDAGSSSFILIENRRPLVGSASVALQIDPNRSFNSRTAVLAVKDESGEARAGQPLTQRAASCLYSIEPTSRTFGRLGTSDGSDVGLFVARVHAEPSDCRWTAAPTVPWIQTLNRTDAGTGDASVDVAVFMNGGASSRVGELVVSGLSGVNPDARLKIYQSGR